MKFLVDAHLPRRLAISLNNAGHDAIHTLELPEGNASTDSQINTISINEQRVVITKDSDFVNTFLLTQRPYKLLLISTGNITNMELEKLFFPQLDMMVAAFEEYRFLELNRAAVIIHM